MNKELAEFCGICWHEEASNISQPFCGKCNADWGRQNLNKLGEEK